MYQKAGLILILTVISVAMVITVVIPTKTEKLAKNLEHEITTPEITPEIGIKSGHEIQGEINENARVDAYLVPNVPCETGKVDRSLLPWCSRTSQLVNGTWNGKWFEPGVCNIRRVSPEEACECFRDKTIGLVGDSTIAGLWRELPSVFGKMRKFGPEYDLEFLEKMRKPGDVKVHTDTTYRKDSHNFQFRHWVLWRMEMWAQFTFSRDSANNTISSVLANTTHDAVMLNIGTHHMPPDFYHLTPLLNFYTKLDEFARNETQVKVPTIFVSTNAQYPPKKAATRAFQDSNYSRIVNDLAHYAFEINKPQKIPMADFHPMMEAGLPWTSRDGTHSTAEMDQMKVRTLVSLMCPEGGIFRTLISE